LHNEDQIKRLDIRIGDTIILRKAGDVIPEVVMVLKELRPKNSRAYNFPKTVVGCGGDGSIERIPGISAYRCVSLDSDFLRRQSMYYFVSKNALNMDGVGPRIIDALLENKLISDVSDLFLLKSEQLYNLPGFQKKAAENVVEAINKSRQVTLARLLIGLSIEHVGEETAHLLAKNFANIDLIRKATYEDLVAIDGIGEVIAKEFVDWQSDNVEQNLLNKLLPHLTIVNDDIVITNNKLNDKSFLFTGSLVQLTRSEAQQLVRKFGGVVVSSISKKTDYLVVGNDPGSKVKQAKDLGV
jgi:DNA ligase (NAD+)